MPLLGNGCLYWLFSKTQIQVIHIKWNLSIYLENQQSINEYVNHVNDITVGCNLFCHPATSSNHFFLMF